MWLDEIERKTAIANQITGHAAPMGRDMERMARVLRELGRVVEIIGRLPGAISELYTAHDDLSDDAKELLSSRKPKL